ncbi:unnamed protein product [Linum tenue]|uniref:Phytocyanin domain-containing protein n=1 Tax=Linum tenue TaxID=586396 RepID=A0AAV0HQS7_9ROSI|nr:unnamed protein product [Linum tenue]
MKLMVMAGAVVVILIIMAGSGESSVLEKVGSRKGWIPNFNYTQWSSTQHHLYVGDWLLFVFDKRYYNVLEVNKTSYDGCEEKGFARNITKGGRDVVELTEARPYYFISGGGYCWGGMKVAVNVEARPVSLAPAPAPSSHANDAVALPANYYHVACASICFMIIILYIIVV